ncbi:hypothetical protein FRB99_007709 [Tulasnella sp. 403]|nr:hypothetical protein FRB99_007709 [Tulasnella sp. 403]
MLGGPLGISLAPAIQKSKSLSKFFLPIAQAYANAVGHRRLGLRYDDLLVEEREDVQKALNRLTPRESYDRVYRLRVLHQQSILHTDLPKEKWLDPKNDVRYLAPVVADVAVEDQERVTWDTMEVKVQNSSSKSEGENVSPATSGGSDDKAISKDEPKPPLATRVWTKVKHEAAHYYHGSKLLVSEVRISSRLMLKVMRGSNLTRRENRQLRRTTSDLLRLIPFSVFVIVPFMELLLPVAIKLFPNMLPSTFEDKFAAEEKERKLIQVRLEMAKFLQDTLRESPLKSNAKIVGTEEFKQFFRKVRSTGDPPSTDEIINVAKLFDDDMTLDNLTRPQLVSVCRYMNVNAFGTDNYLRGQIRGRLERIRRDDAVIFEEGIASLSTKELQQACQARGIRTTGTSPSRLREELEGWIDLHYTNKVSGVLLILSRAFDWVRTGSGDKSEGVMHSLQSVLSTLPDTLLSEAELEVDEKATYKQKLEVLKQQEELIEDEAEQEEKEEEARRIQKEAEEKARRDEEALVRELLPDSELQETPVVEEVVDVASDARMTSEQLNELAQALAILSAKSTVVQERDELRELVEEYKRENQSETPSKLILKIQSMLDKIDKQIASYDSKVGLSLNHINVDSEGRLTVGDLERALKLIKHAPGDDLIAGIVKKLDVDSDGYVVLEDVLALVKDEGLGIVVDDAEEKLLGVGRDMRDDKPRKEDILQS